AVVDTADTGAQGPVDTAWMVGVHRRIAVVVIGLLHRGSHLVVAVLHGRHLVQWRGHTTGQQHLQMCCALAELVTGGLTYRIHSVGDAREIRSLLAAGLVVIGFWRAGRRGPPSGTAP